MSCVWMETFNMLVGLQCWSVLRQQISQSVFNETLFMSVISYITDVLPITPQARYLNCVFVCIPLTNIKQRLQSQSLHLTGEAYIQEICIVAQSREKIYCSSELAGNIFNTHKQKTHMMCFVLFRDRYYKARILCLYGVCIRGNVKQQH